MHRFVKPRDSWDQYAKISMWQWQGNPEGKQTERIGTLPEEHLHYQVRSSGGHEL